jgi:hypothetical protein
MLDHCARCKRETSLEVMSSQQVLTDAGGLVWIREDLRCAWCGWVDVDYVTTLTPDPLSAHSCARRGEKKRCPGPDPLPVVDGEIERRLSAEERGMLWEALLRTFGNPTPGPSPSHEEGNEQRGAGRAIRGKIRKFEE